MKEAGGNFFVFIIIFLSVYGAAHLYVWWRLIKPLRRLQGKYGVYAVTGNHEFFAGEKDVETFLERAHVTLLRNRWVNINGGLQLSGHTHKGQLWPFQYIVKNIFKTPYELFTNGNATIYVSRGTGAWGPPMRVGAHPEITLITLASKD
jgi:predicted MPP superfamily phosphohydrolase